MNSIKETLQSLHAALASVLLDQVEAQKHSGEEGPDSRLLNVARQFLKDNKIEGLAAEGSELEKLMEGMEDFDPDQEDQTEIEDYKLKIG